MAIQLGKCGDTGERSQLGVHNKVRWEMSASVIQPLPGLPGLHSQQALVENDRVEKSALRCLFLLLKVGIGLLIVLSLFAVVSVVPVT